MEQTEETQEEAPPPGDSAAEDAASTEKADEQRVSRAVSGVTEQTSGLIDTGAAEAEAEAVEADNVGGMKPAPRIESGCRLDRDVLLSSLNEVRKYLQQSDVHEQTDESFIGKLSEMVHVLNADMNNLRAYCERSQNQLQSIRTPIKDITDKIFKTITVPETAEKEGEQPPERSTNLEELQLQLHQKTLHNHLAKINDELLRMSKITVETESAVVEASIACVEAVEVAKQVQEQLETKRKEEKEALERQAELKRIEEEKRRAEQERLLEEERKELEMMRQRELEANQWPWHAFEMVSQADFDNGVCCVARADPMFFLPDERMTCEYVDLRDVEFEYVENEELIGHIIKISADVPKVRCPVTICIPHCMPRQHMASREPIVKAELEPGKWTELSRTIDVTLDGFKDAHFAQTEIKRFTKLAIVSRFKKDTIKLKKRGGKRQSKVDSRVHFLTSKGQFGKKDKVVLQMQPVDTAALAELRKRMPAANGLLCAGSIVSLNWTVTSFTSPLIMTLPVPANPVTLKKAAAAQAAKELKEAKEAKAKEKATGDEEAKEEKPKAEEKPRKSQLEDKSREDEGDDKTKETLPASWLKPVKWFMGQFAKDSEDERDLLYFMRNKPSASSKSKWSVEQIPLTQTRLDAVELEMKEPIDKFVVLRTTILVTEKEAEKMTDMLYTILTHRIVTMVLKQQEYDPCDVRLYVLPSSKIDRALKKLDDLGYDAGPEPSSEFSLREGDHLEVAFRGNVKCVDDVPQLNAVFTTNLDTTVCMHIQQHDVFVQKSYNVYRGFVQMRKVTKIPLSQADRDRKSGMGFGQPPAAAPPAPAEPAPAPPPAQEGEAAGAAGDAGAVPVDQPPVEELPPPPMFEIKSTLVSQLLITFPKDPELLSAKPLRKVPLHYIPTNEPITEQVLRDVASQLGPEWTQVAAALGITRPRVQVIQRNAMLQSTPPSAVNFQMLIMWTKALPKCADKYEQLRAALSTAGREDIANFLDDIRSKFEPGTKTIARTQMEENGKISRGVMATTRRR